MPSPVTAVTMRGWLGQRLPADLLAHRRLVVHRHEAGRPEVGSEQDAPRSEEARPVELAVAQQPAQQKRVRHDRARIAHRRHPELQQRAQERERHLAIPAVARLALLIDYIAGDVRMHVDQPGDDVLPAAVDDVRAVRMRVRACGLDHRDATVAEDDVGVRAWGRAGAVDHRHVVDDDRFRRNVLLEGARHPLDEGQVGRAVHEVARLQPVREVKKDAVRREPDVGLKRAQDLELAPVVGDCVRIARIRRQHVAVRHTRTAQEGDAVRTRVVDNRRGPRGATGRVAGRDACRHRGPAQRDRFAVSKDTVGCDCRIHEAVAELRIAVPAARQQRRVGAAGVEQRARGTLQLSQAAGVIVVRVAVQQDAHVLGAESEAADVRQDQRRGFDEAAVDHDVPCRCRDEE